MFNDDEGTVVDVVARDRARRERHQAHGPEGAEWTTSEQGNWVIRECQCGYSEAQAWD